MHHIMHVHSIDIYIYTSDEAKKLLWDHWDAPQNDVSVQFSTDFSFHSGDTKRKKPAKSLEAARIAEPLAKSKILECRARETLGQLPKPIKQPSNLVKPVIQHNDVKPENPRANKRPKPVRHPASPPYPPNFSLSLSHSLSLFPLSLPFLSPLSLPPLPLSLSLCLCLCLCLCLVSVFLARHLLVDHSCETSIPANDRWQADTNTGHIGFRAA
jgi:hypothetical protein